MVGVEPGDVITLRIKGGGVVRAKKVVLTTGGWGRKLLSQLGLDVYLQVSIL